jgi:Carboxypeptidase regulatory-like domain
VNRVIFKFGGTLALLLAACAMHAEGAAKPASISGLVRDSAGTPQIGAMVELLSSDEAVLATTFTDRHGHFRLGAIDPGTYSVKAVGTAFLPALRENLRVRTDTVVNLTLTTLFEAAQWLPAQKRTSSDSDDDWIWTLRSSSNRPLLRMLEDGPLVIVTESDSDSRPVMKARITLSSADHTFGEGGVRNAFEVTRSKSDHQQLILRANFAGGGSSAFESLVGYRKDLGPGRTLRSVVSVENRPQIVGTAEQSGLQSMVVRTSQTMMFTPELHAEVGNEMQALRLGQMEVSNHPFLGVIWNSGDNAVSYRLATSLGLQRADEVDAENSTAPIISNANGVAHVEHGLHQQIAYERADNNVHVKMAVYADSLIDPAISGGGDVSDADLAEGNVLYDTSSRLLRVQGPDYSAGGFVGSVKARIFRDTWMSIAFADGTALEMDSTADGASLEQTLKAIRPAHSQMYAVALNGKVNRTGTKWRASYRWQPSDSLTEIAPFDGTLPDGFFAIYLRQPIHCAKMFPAGMEALVDVRNLLAEGYRPFVTSDGSTLYFAQTERSIQGGLSFTF